MALRRAAGGRRRGVPRLPDAHALERLLRRLLKLPSFPAVVLVNLPTLKQLDGEKAAEGEWIQPLAAHYRLPSFSLIDLLRTNADRVDASRGGRRALAAHVNLTAGWYQCSNHDTAGLGCARLKGEAAPHPNQYGHELVAMGVARLLQRARTMGVLWTGNEFGGGSGMGGFFV